MVSILVSILRRNWGFSHNIPHADAPTLPVSFGLGSFRPSGARISSRRNDRDLGFASSNFISGRKFRRPPRGFAYEPAVVVVRSRYHCIKYRSCRKDVVGLTDTLQRRKGRAPRGLSSRPQGCEKVINEHRAPLDPELVQGRCKLHRLYRVRQIAIISPSWLSLLRFRGELPPLRLSHAQCPAARLISAGSPECAPAVSATELYRDQ